MARELANISTDLWRALDQYDRQQLVHDLMARGFFPLTSPILYGSPWPPAMVRNNTADSYSEEGGLVIGIGPADPLPIPPLKPPPPAAGIPTWLWLVAGGLVGLALTRL